MQFVNEDVSEVHLHLLGNKRVQHKLRSVESGPPLKLTSLFVRIQNITLQWLLVKLFTGNALNSLLK